MLPWCHTWCHCCAEPEQFWLEKTIKIIEANSYIMLSRPLQACTAMTAWHCWALLVQWCCAFHGWLYVMDWVMALSWNILRSLESCCEWAALLCVGSCRVAVAKSPSRSAPFTEVSQSRLLLQHQGTSNCAGASVSSKTALQHGLLTSSCNSVIS